MSVAPSVARADEPDYSNPNVMRGLLQKLSTDNPDAPNVLAHLSPKAKAAVLDVVKRSRVMRESVIDDDPTDTETAESYCPSGSQLMKFRNNFSYYDPITNWVQWRVTQVAKYCHNGAWLTKVKIPFRRITKIYLIGWQFGDYFGDWQDGGQGQAEYEDFFQARLRYCLPVCYIESDPWLYAWVAPGRSDACSGTADEPLWCEH